MKVQLNGEMSVIGIKNVISATNITCKFSWQSLNSTRIQSEQACQNLNILIYTNSKRFSQTLICCMMSMQTSDILTLHSITPFKLKQMKCMMNESYNCILLNSLKLLQGRLKNFHLHQCSLQ